ncbi:MAG: tetratricopeptide repeat protein [Candidatus Sericytochromatia bacterium]
MFIPSHPLLRAGLAHQRQQRWEMAADCYLGAATAEPLQSRFLLSWLAHARQQPDLAREHLEAVLAIEPNFCPAWELLGYLALEAGETRTACDLLERALALAPENARLLLALGQARLALGDFSQARADLSRYLQADSDDADAWQLLAAAHRELGLIFHEALCLERCLALRPADADIFSQLAYAWLHIGQRQGVQRYFDCLLQLSPAGEAWFNALPAASRAELAAQRDLIYFQYLMLLYADPELSDQRFFDIVASLPEPAIAPLPPAPAAKTSRPARPMRVGYLSRELGDYSSSRALRPLLSQHSDRVELYAYNDTPKRFQNAATEAFKPLFAHWREVSEQNNAELAALIRADEIEVLVDMGGITIAGRRGLFARRPAPVQIGGLGFGFSACHQGIEYCFSDARLCPPEIAARYPEEVVYLSSAFHWQAPEAYASGDVPLLRNGYLTFGSANTLNKLNPRVIRLWARLLRQLPEARLFLKTFAFNDELVQQYWRESFEVHGVDARQLQFAGQGEAAHMPDFYPRVDIALDPFPYQGGVTSCEALWMGVPVLSLRHPDWQARAGTAGILAVMGLEDWLADSEESYLERALAWAADPDFLQRQRRQLRERLLHSPICDAAAAAREIEAAFFRLRKRAGGVSQNL